MRLGVIIARFQVPSLHDGHHHLIQHVLEANDATLILLGTCKPDNRNPLPFEARVAMISECYQPDLDSISMVPLPDQLTDAHWSKLVDAKIKHHCRTLKCDVTLYGSRDSFASHYHGIHKVEEVPPLEGCPSGTECRGTVSMVSSEDFRKGIIYAYNTMYETED